MLTLALVLAAAPLTAEEPSGRFLPPTRRSECLVQVGSPEAPRRHHTFRATKILDLEFSTTLRKRVEGEHVLQLRVYTPRGFLYQTLAVPFERARDRKPEPGPARAVKARYFEPEPTDLTARLPVAGTSIMASALYGKWTVVPHLDGSPEPCGPGRSFVIRP
jgi:hypothetical protein